jgi:hypothetical protein
MRLKQAGEFLPSSPNIGAERTRRLARVAWDVVFSDESRSGEGPDNSWVRIRRGAWNRTATASHAKFPMGLMFWAAIGQGYRSKLMLMSGRVDSECLRKAQLNWMDRICNAEHGEKWYFMQDGAPCHTEVETIERRIQLCRVLPAWPPNSPDLNSIEMSWAILGQKFAGAGKTFGTKAELCAALEGAGIGSSSARSTIWWPISRERASWWWRWAESRYRNIFRHT